MPVQTPLSGRYWAARVQILTHSIQSTVVAFSLISDKVLKPGGVHVSVNTADQTADDVTVTAAAGALASSDSLESLARPFLELLHTLTDLDSTYLTQIHWRDQLQEIKFSNNSGALEITEGLRVPWEDTVCRRALETGKQSTTDAATDFPGLDVVGDLGLQTYISVPVIDRQDGILGTLCGASGESVQLTDGVRAVMEMFAQLIADRWQRDIEQEEAERRAADAEQQLKERTIFLAEAEHQMKSPLAVIKGWASLLTSSWESLPETQRREGVGLILNSSEKLIVQVDQLLLEARNAVLAAKLESQPQPLAPLFERVKVELSALSNKHAIEVAVDDDCIAWIDREAMWQVLVHLVENAVKYSPEGGTIEIEAMTNKAFTVITVRDDGLGVPSDIDVFEAFQRSNEHRFASIPGTGVGLHIVRTLVESMGGTIGAVRNEGKGSTFTISLRGC